MCGTALTALQAPGGPSHTNQHLFTCVFTSAGHPLRQVANVAFHLMCSFVGTTHSPLNSIKQGLLNIERQLKYSTCCTTETAEIGFPLVDRPSGPAARANRTRPYGGPLR